MKIFRNRKPKNNKEVERLAEKIEKITAQAKKKEITKYEFYIQQLDLFQRINQYNLSGLDIEKDIKRGIKIAKKSIALLEATHKGVAKIEETKVKIEDKKKELSKRFKKVLKGVKK